MNKLPNDITEDEFVEIVGRISGRLISKFRFGYHTLEDIRQQVYVELLKADRHGLSIIDKYDEGAGHSFESYLWVAIRNRLYNFKRDNYGRPDQPNEAKKSLMSTKEYNEFADSRSAPDDSQSAYSKEIFSIIDADIPVELRKDWLMLVNGVRLPKTRKDKVVEKMQQILFDRGVNYE